VLERNKLLRYNVRQKGVKIMPSFQIHLAIAKKYIEKHEVQDKDAFMEGSIAPDFVRPKEKSHYTIGIPNDDLVENAKNKVDLKRYLKENKVETDYEKGVFLHLLTDKIFFTEFFDEDYYKQTTYQEFCEDLYISYNKTNSYIEEKYHIVLKKDMIEKIREDIEKSKKEKKVILQEGKNILPLDKIDAFIERMSNVNLEEYITKE